MQTELEMLKEKIRHLEAENEDYRIITMRQGKLLKNLQKQVTEGIILHEVATSYMLERKRATLPPEQQATIDRLGPKERK